MDPWNQTNRYLGPKEGRKHEHSRCVPLAEETPLHSTWGCSSTTQTYIFWLRVLHAGQAPEWVQADLIRLQRYQDWLSLIFQYTYVTRFALRIQGSGLHGAHAGTDTR